MPNTMRTGRPARLLVGLLAAGLAFAGAHDDVVWGAAVSEHQKEIEAWRAQRIAKLKSDEGWLVVAGLFWLEPGKNGFGSAAGNTVALPAHSAPPHAGTLELAGKEV